MESREPRARGTQTDQILAWLRKGYSLTALDALDQFGCFRLAARINDARKVLMADEEITVTMERVGEGKKVARYRLVQTTPAQTSLWR